MATNNSICGLCEGLDLSEPSTAWCIECEQSLCNNCDKRHKLIRETKSHHTIPIDQCRQLPSEMLKISQTCQEHNESYQTYCDKHECLCCIECILTTHRECKNMCPLDKVVAGVKVSNALEECQAKLVENKENISLVIKDRQQSLLQLKEQKEKIQSEIRETRRKVNNHLDKIEKQLLQELSKLQESYTAKCQTLISTLEAKEKQMEKMRETLSIMKDHATDLQVFLEIKKIEKLSLSEDKNVKKLVSDGELNIPTLSVELNQALKTVERSIPTFGCVSVESRPCYIVLKKEEDKQVQLRIPNVRSFESIGLELIREIDFDKPDVWGCCFLPDGKYAVASYTNKCIVVMKEDGTVDCQIDVKPHKIIDITHIPSTNTLAATSDHDQKHNIHVIDIDTRKITKSLTSHLDNSGITYNDGQLYYCATEVGICKMNLKDGKETTMKSIPSMSQLSYIASHRDYLYYTNRSAHTVTCCSIDGTTEWEFKDENVLSLPRGISVDNNGNVCVLGCFTNNLVVLSSDGSHHSELLTEEDGLFSPVALDYDMTRNRLLITNDYQKMFLYKLS